MNTFLNIVHLIISIFGAFFLGYLLFKIWQENRWRFKRGAYKKRVEIRKAESRLQAKANGKKKFKYNDGKLIIWAKSMRAANRKFASLSQDERNSNTEIFE